MVYFDHNATTPLLPEARAAWLEAAAQIGNPSSPHRLGSRADAALHDAREQLAAFLDCHPQEIIFTSGATESSNTVLHHYARSARDGEIWISQIEHPCVIEPAAFYFGKRVRFIPVNAAGVVEMDWLERELSRARPALVVLMAANNETGALQPWPRALALCRAAGVPFFCDAAQWVGKLPAAGLGHCEWVSGCAHKFGGPRGIGFLKVPSGTVLTPLIRGGPQEEQRRAGTENVAGAVAMLAALDVREEMIARRAHESLASLRDQFERRVMNAVPGAQMVAGESPRLWNTCSALMPSGAGRARWVVKLDRLGFAVSTGSACASGKEEPSHVLRAMGLADRAAGALRFSGGWETTSAEWDALAEGLAGIYKLVLEKSATSG